MAKYGNPDLIQYEIVQALRQSGCSVAILTAVGGGFPDLLVARSGVMVLMELKAEKYADLSEQQKDWHDKWKANIRIVHNIDEALDAINEAVKKAGR